MAPVQRRATTWSTTKSSVVSHDFHPHPRFSFFWKDPNFDEGSQRFWKESPAHLENLRNDTRIFALECQNSARRARHLQNLPNLPTLKNLQNLRCRSAHCLQPVIPVPLRGGGRSSERCSEGPDVLIYTADAPRSWDMTGDGRSGRKLTKKRPAMCE